MADHDLTFIVDKGATQYLWHSIAQIVISFEECILFLEVILTGMGF